MSPSSSINPPALEAGQYLTRQNLYEFFAQIYGDNVGTRNRSGVLFANLVRAAMPLQSRPIPFVVICTTCNKSVRTKTPVRHQLQHEVHLGSWEFRIGARSLKVYSQQFLALERKRQTTIVDDFKQLLVWL
jgi:hypothetical protein